MGREAGRTTGRHDVTGASSKRFWQINILAVVVAGACLVTPAAGRAAEKRVALIIANSRYDRAVPLRNPGPDAQLIRQSLARVGFDTITVVENLGKQQMEAALLDFAKLADSADVAVIYYAGHGMEIDHTNYVIPVDARITSTRDVEFATLKLDSIMHVVDGAKRLRVVILDACRENPFLSQLKQAGGTRAWSQGLAEVEPPNETLVVYASKAGRVALDGNGQNSPFASAVARRLVEDGVEINLMFRKVRDDVIAATSGAQEPWTYGSLSSKQFYFRPAKAIAGASVATAAPEPDLEADAWALCKGGASRLPCESYLRTYPNGRFATLARTRVADFDAARGELAAAARGAAVKAAPATPAPAVAPPAGFAAASPPALGGATRGSGGRTVIAIGPIATERECKVYGAVSGRSATVTDGYVAANVTSWTTRLYKDCMTQFAGIRTALQSALASTGKISVGAGGLQVSGRVSNIARASTGFVDQSSIGGESAIADSAYVVSMDVTVRDRAGRIVYGFPIRKRVETGFAANVSGSSTLSTTDGDGIYGMIQQQIAQAVARALIQRIDPIRVTGVEGRQITLNYGEPIVEFGTIVDVAVPGSASVIRYRVQSALNGAATALQEGDGDGSRIPAGAIATVIEPESGAANRSRFEKVDLPY